MRKLFLSASLLLGTVLFSQIRGIVFETGNMASVLEKAKKENKLIFVDAYTSWCGPCKWMSKNIFTNDTVANFFNKTFVNYALDMEKGEGIEFAKKYEVSCYPSLLFINGDGKIVHRGAGGLPVRPFMELAENSLTIDKTFYAYKERIEKEGIDDNNISIYIQLLSSVCFDPSTCVEKYMKTLKGEDLLKNNNWLLLKDYVKDYNSEAIKYFINNIATFESKFGKAETDKKMAQLGYQYFYNFYNTDPIDKVAFEKTKEDFKALNWPMSKATLFDADLSYLERTDKTKYYSVAAKEFLEYHSNDANDLNNIAWIFYEKVTDKEQINAACKMAKRACELENRYVFLDTYAAILYKSGNLKEAEIIANKAIDKAKAENHTAEGYKETTDLLKKIKAKK